MKSFLQNDIEMHSMHNQGKSVTTERFIIRLKSKVRAYDLNIKKCLYW